MFGLDGIMRCAFSWGDNLLGIVEDEWMGIKEGDVENIPGRRDLEKESDR